MITVAQAEQIHEILISNFGGAGGIRDKDALSSALSRPNQTFDGIDLYPSVSQKAASLIESILVNHPFVDGNKRTGYVLMRLMLLNYDLDIKASQQEKYDFVINIASGKTAFDSIVQWLENHLIKNISDL